MAFTGLQFGHLKKLIELFRGSLGLFSQVELLIGSLIHRLQLALSIASLFLKIFLLLDQLIDFLNHLIQLLLNRISIGLFKILTSLLILVLQSLLDLFFDLFQKLDFLVGFHPCRFIIQ